MRTKVLALLLFWTVLAVSCDKTRAEAGMIPFDSPVGEIGGRGHWYTLRTMRGSLYWDDPAVSSDVTRGEDGGLRYLGEAPVSLALVLHPDWYAGDEPWRRAIDWVRQAEQMFRNSGVHVRFLIESIETLNGMPDTKREAYDFVPYDAIAKRTGADLVVGLMPHYFGDALCGIARLNGRRSMSGCGPKTLAHELGHNFGLQHAHAPAGYEGRKGYCVDPYADAEDCNKGTLMSYASSSGRIPLFAANGYSFDGEPMGTEDHSAVDFLRQAVIDAAMRWESADVMSLSLPQDLTCN